MDLPAEAGLRIAGLAKSFGGAPALCGIGTDVLPGEVHAVVGANGLGKSTFVKTLAGFHAPDELESAFIGGKEFEAGSPAATNEAGVRLVHQEFGLIESMSAADSLGIGQGFETGILGIRWRSERRRSAAAIARLGYEIDVTPIVGAAGLAHPIETSSRSSCSSASCLAARVRSSLPGIRSIGSRQRWCRGGVPRFHADSERTRERAGGARRGVGPARRRRADVGE